MWEIELDLFLKPYIPNYLTTIHRSLEFWGGNKSRELERKIRKEKKMKGTLQNVLHWLKTWDYIIKILRKEILFDCLPKYLEWQKCSKKCSLDF